ncbi:COBRA-like protein 1 [Hibiscus syriacus]|uniref:COBRA-like protein n=1 Tax=Hibiscus syriacus TaxID=106335 RepID=A0A6A3A2X3_HIBSY|nr:COBRA-like protein 6 [Hibiscus syriacus]KAE8698644.1 COBRA-like protein 1 [Hibiscus syriacus]
MKMNPFYFVVQRSSHILFSFIFLCFLFSSISPSFGYDPLDPYGNITLKWDLLTSDTASNYVRVSMLNFQKYRHIEQPGWKLGWDWKGDEAIWNMLGAEATEQGNCSRFKGGQLPHCCERTPSIVDLLPGTPYNMQTTNCCKGGVLSSMIQDPSKYGSVFEMTVSSATKAGFNMPENFTIGVQGYTCGDAVPVAPSKYSLDGRRWTQALGTWNVTCMYSQFLASTTPKCCVSLSAFYNSTIVPCPKCSCSCQGLPGAKCLNSGETPSLLREIKDKNREPPSLVRCSEHMCPIWIHWHVKQSYTSYWRVKITVHNQNIVKNYSEWNLVALHPNLKSVVQVFSFNYEPLSQYEFINDTGMFWGIKFYNDMLLQEGAGGNVQTEMLLQKDPGMFTFREGWGFPRRILFNGDECVMPPPDQYPRLPNIGQHDAKFSIVAIFFSLLLMMLCA